MIYTVSKKVIIQVKSELHCNFSYACLYTLKRLSFFVQQWFNDRVRAEYNMLLTKGLLLLHDNYFMPIALFLQKGNEKDIFYYLLIRAVPNSWTATVHTNWSHFTLTLCNGFITTFAPQSKKNDYRTPYKIGYFMINMIIQAVYHSCLISGNYRVCRL